MTSDPENDVESDDYEDYRYKCYRCMRLWGLTRLSPGEERSVRALCRECIEGIKGRDMIVHKARYLFDMEVQDSVKAISEILVYILENNDERR